MKVQKEKECPTSKIKKAIEYTSCHLLDLFLKELLSQLSEFCRDVTSFFILRMHIARDECKIIYLGAAVTNSKHCFFSLERHFLA